ncbi:MAG: hypothetical protein AMDU4_FER2C00081G0002 [Ferroplasma sp. Type II]|nr:MAG: hypothetical protein AMDU4_FER2C00081G0002 [Ferroplasma sp. Type II]
MPINMKIMDNNVIIFIKKEYFFIYPHLYDLKKAYSSTGSSFLV